MTVYYNDWIYDWHELPYKNYKKKKQLHELFRNNLTTYTKSRASNEQIAVYSLSKKKKKLSTEINEKNHYQRQ